MPHRQREGGRIRLRPPLLPCAEDHRQRSPGERSHAGIPFRRALCHARADGRRARQCEPRRHQDQRDHGAERRLPYRRRLTRPRRREQWRESCRPRSAASHLSARGALLHRHLPRRCRICLRQARALPDRGQRGHSRRERRGDWAEADARARRGRRARQCAALWLWRARRRARRPREDGLDPEGRQGAPRARRYVRLYPALLAAPIVRRRGRSPSRRPLRSRACRKGRQERFGDHPPHQQRA